MGITKENLSKLKPNSKKKKFIWGLLLGILFITILASFFTGNFWHLLYGALINIIVLLFWISDVCDLDFG